MAPVLPPAGRLPTIGDLAAEGLRLRIFCHRCWKPEVRVDAGELVARLGPATTIAGIARHFRCDGVKAGQPCGGRGSTGDLYVMPEQPGAPMGVGHHDHQADWREAEERTRRRP